ncbi:MAG TPA: hypothetical protein VEC06_16355 [Paucimonas sp.]|nr:hypothetical protein [Paucimonas sp.]
MNYQTRKRLMMADVDLPEFAPPRPAAATATPEKLGRGAAEPAFARQQSEACAKEFRLHELTMLSLGPIFRGIHRWWLERAERHYLICADVEEQRAREAQLNVAYYQKRAALARSARMT